MLRSLFSVVVVILFVATAALLYLNFGTAKNAVVKELTDGGTPPAAPAPQPTPAPQPPAPPPVAPPPEKKEIVQAPEPKPEPRRGKRTHIVQTGESLSSISKKYFGTSDYYSKIAESNNLRSRDCIRVGQVLVLPDLPFAAPTETVSEPVTPQLTNTPADPQDFEPQPPTLNVAKPRP